MLKRALNIFWKESFLWNGKTFLTTSTYLDAAGAAIYTIDSSFGKKVFMRILLVLLNKLYLDSYTSSLIELGSDKNNSAGSSLMLSNNLMLLWRTWGKWNELNYIYTPYWENLSMLYLAEKKETFRTKYIEEWTKKIQILLQLKNSLNFNI